MPKTQTKVVRLVKDETYGLGMTITCGDTYDTVLHGAFIESIYPYSPADCDGNLAPGDQILCVNGVDVQNDPFLDVVDLIKDTSSPVELVIAKLQFTENHRNKLDIVSHIDEEIPELNHINPQTWITSVNNTDELFTGDICNSSIQEGNKKRSPPVPKPRKRFIEKDKLNVYRNMLYDDISKLSIETDSYDQCKIKDTTSVKKITCSIISEHLCKSSCTIPDIIASQMKYKDPSLNADECTEISDENIQISNECKHVHPNLQMSSDSNFCLVNTENANAAEVSPGEIFHVVLDKKGGSLGLNIYQGTDPTCSHQRHIYIHSLIPGGAAKMDNRISSGDKLLEVDGIVLENLSYQEVVAALRESSQVTHLVLEKGNLVLGDSIDESKQFLKNEGCSSGENDTANKNTSMVWNTNQYISRNRNFKIGSMNTFHANCLHKNTSSENDVQMDTISVLRDKQIDIHCLKYSDCASLKSSVAMSFDACDWCLNERKTEDDSTISQDSVAKNFKPFLSLTSLPSLSTNMMPSNISETTLVKCANALIPTMSMPSLNKSSYTYSLQSSPKKSGLPCYQYASSNYDCSFLHSFNTHCANESSSSLNNTEGLLSNSGKTENYSMGSVPSMTCRSTPNLAQASDDVGNQSNLRDLLYKNRSENCLISPNSLNTVMNLSDLNESTIFERVSHNAVHHLPMVPIRKKKIRRMEDIYNFTNSENTFEITIRKSSRGLGLSISGGRETFKKDLFSQLIHVRKLYPLQPAMDCGKISVGDIILEVNGTNMIGLTNTEALEILRSSTSNVTLKLFRPSKSSVSLFSFLKDELQPFSFDSPSSSACSIVCKEEDKILIDAEEFEITLKKREGSLGFTVSKREESLDDGPPAGVYIKALVREPAVSDGRLQPGDRIVQVNGKDVSSMTNVEAIAFLRNAPETIILTLFRCSPPVSPVWFDEHPLSKPLRWEAIELLNDRIKHKNDSDFPDKKMQRKVNKCYDQPSALSSECYSSSSSSSSCREHIVTNLTQDSRTLKEDTFTNCSGLQRNQRPKSLDVLNSSDKKDASEDDNSFHRQASVAGGLTEQKNKKSSNCDNIDDTRLKNGKALLKWRGSTLPNNDDGSSLQSVTLLSSSELQPLNMELDLKNTTQHDSTSEKIDQSVCQDGRNLHSTVPKDFIQMIDVELDRGWHGRLGFSLSDPFPNVKHDSNFFLPLASEVKVVHPGSLAAKDGRIKVGDRLVEVNSESLLGRSATEAIDILRKTRGIIRMQFCRFNKS